MTQVFLQSKSNFILLLFNKYNKIYNEYNFITFLKTFLELNKPHNFMLFISTAQTVWEEQHTEAGSNRNGES